MKLKKISLVNFRSFKNKTEFEFKDLTILIGPNKSGKSNVIEAIRTLTFLAQGLLHKDFRELSFDRQQGNITIEVELEFSDDDRKKIVSHFKQSLQILITRRKGCFDLLDILLSLMIKA